MTTLRQLLDSGLLKSGDQLTWHQKSKGVTHLAKVQSDGTIVTNDGNIHKTPSGAAKHFIQKPVDGWNVWKVNGEKVSLSDLRAKIQN